MGNEVISDKQGIILVAGFIMGSTLILGTGGDAKQDVWLAIILAVAAAIPLVLIYARLLSICPDKEIITVMRVCFGRIIADIILITYIWFAFLLGALVIRNFGDFIVTVGLRATPAVIPMGILTFLCIWVAKEGIEVLGRWAELLIVLILISIVTTTAFLLPKIDLNIFRPVLYNGVGPVLKGALSSLTYPFAETGVLIVAFYSFKSKGSPYKIYLSGLLIGGLLVLFISVRNMAVLGPFTLSSAYFPSYIAIRRINIGEFIQRLEILVGMVFVIAGLVKISICLIAMSRGLAWLSGIKDYRYIVTPAGLLMLITSRILFVNLMEMREWAFEIYQYYALPFEVIFPLLVFIILEIRMRSQKVKAMLKKAPGKG